MAVTLVTQPTSKTALHSDWYYRLDIDDIGGAGVEKRIAYKVINMATGENIMPLTTVKMPDTNTPLILNFSQEIARYMLTPVFHAQTGRVIFPAPYINEQKIEIQLVYGEMVFNNNADPCSVNLDLPNTSNIAAFYNWAENGLGNLSSERIQNTKAELLYWCMGFPDYISTMEAVDVPYIVRYGGVNSQVSPEQVLNLSAENNTQFLFDEHLPSGSTIPEPVKAVEFYFDDFRDAGEKGESTTYIFDKCECCEGELKAALMFLDRKGGRNVIPFGCIDETSINFNQTVVCLTDFKVNFSDVRMNFTSPDAAYKDRAINKEAYESISLSVNQPNTPRNKQFFNQFYASPEHHLLIMDKDEVLRISPVVLLSGGVTRTDENDLLRLSAEIRHSQKEPNQFR